jgi:hypothetical protein|eukprot:COSAG02_NODE_1668_length_11402_cov_21.101743_10_plen_38_part_00
MLLKYSDIVIVVTRTSAHLQGLPEQAELSNLGPSDPS